MELDYISLRPVKPALTGYIRKAQSLIKTSTYPDEKMVHDVRVLMKKSRSILKLIAPQMTDGFAEREIQELRDVGREMSSWRESSVLQKNLKSLKKHHSALFNKLQENEKLVSLMYQPDNEDETNEVITNKLELILEKLNKTAFRIRFEQMDKIDPNLLLKELERSYNVVIDNYLKSRNKPVPGNLHKFRKRSKDFLYQLWFFKPLNTATIKDLEKRLDNMAQNLGKYNDLAQIIKAFGYNYKATSNQPELDELILIIRKEQERYISKIWPVAHKYFCPGSKLINVLGFKLLII